MIQRRNELTFDVAKILQRAPDDSAEASRTAGDEARDNESRVNHQKVRINGGPCKREKCRRAVHCGMNNFSYNTVRETLLHKSTAEPSITGFSHNIQH